MSAPFMFLAIAMCLYLAQACASVWRLRTGGRAGGFEQWGLAGLALVLHLIPVYAGYASFAVAAAAALAYLIQQRILRRKRPGSLWRGLPSLETLDRLGRSAVSLGFPVLTLGLVVGVFWAERGSALLGRAWYGDPKVVSGIVVWLIYAGVLHLRLFGRFHGKRAAVLTVAGFLIALVTFAASHAYSEPNPAEGVASEATRDL